MLTLNRRHFLSGSALGFAGATGMLGQLAGHKAWAADVTGYKALVCIFLGGGMDHADTIIPRDTASYNNLREIRSELFDKHYQASKSGSTRNRDNLLSLNPVNASEFGSRRFGLPPNMANIRQMFNSGEAAIIGNVGPLLEPTNRTSYEKSEVDIPPYLFSHNDQESTWMSLGAEGSTTGWGGLFADAVLEADPNADPVYTAITTDRNDVFLAGRKSRQFRASSSGTTGLRAVQTNRIIGKGSTFDPVRNAVSAFMEKNDFDHDSVLTRDIVNASSNGITKSKKYNTIKENIPTVIGDIEFPEGRLGQQLKDVARTIELRNDLVESGRSINRQVFFVYLGGFDTHNDQADVLPALQSELNDSLGAFRTAMQDLDLWNNVTAFTASDFGRTTTSNGDGTDHGWGNHHFVMGGSVKGQRVYGELPDYSDLSGIRFTENKGRLIPSTAVEQYAATLGKWFGLNSGELDNIFPLLSRFSNSDLGFMR